MQNMNYKWIRIELIPNIIMNNFYLFFADIMQGV